MQVQNDNLNKQKQKPNHDHDHTEMLNKEFVLPTCSGKFINGS